ncbi:hypothetical protein P7K49_026073 [Saguinus oedipus]|uniref:Secreted protein n=1 Tax=Saguinus oedipus TaxID=9490 RepID=A0ABQ9UIY2_SAGOE|nr:hypothetical protein P7K49_026073 [Saguinus oedipus]
MNQTAVHTLFELLLLSQRGCCGTHRRVRCLTLHLRTPKASVDAVGPTEGTPKASVDAVGPTEGSAASRCISGHPKPKHYFCHTVVGREATFWSPSSILDRNPGWEEAARVSAVRDSLQVWQGWRGEQRASSEVTEQGPYPGNRADITLTS